MSDDKAAPKFLKPGDDPELDRLLDEARREGSEPLGGVYHDMFGRLRRAPAAAHDRTTQVQSGRSNRNDKSVSPGPVVNETRAAGGPRRMAQSRVLALSVVGILGPVIVVTIVALRPGPGAESKRADDLAATSGVASPGAAIEPRAIAGGEAPVPAPASGGEAPARATLPIDPSPAPTGPGAKLGPKGSAPKSSGDSTPHPSAKPRKPNPGTDIW